MDEMLPYWISMYADDFIVQGEDAMCNLNLNRVNFDYVKV